MTVIEAHTEAVWKQNWMNFRAQWQPLYSEVINYIQDELIDKFKKKIVKCWTDNKLYFGTRTTSRGERGYKILKNDFGYSSRGDLKDVINAFYLLLNRLHNSIREQEAYKELKNISKFHIDLLKDVRSKATNYALDYTIKQNRRLRVPAIVKDPI